MGPFLLKNKEVENTKIQEEVRELQKSALRRSFAKVEISRERVFMMMMLSRSSSRWRFWNVRVVVE